MKYVEDIILELSGVDQNGLWIGKKPFEVSKFDLKYIDSFAISLIEGKYLTDKQQKLAIKILFRNKFELINAYNLDADSFFSNPPWKNSPRSIDRTKKIYIDNNCICLKSPYDQAVIDKIKLSARNYKNISFKFDTNTKLYTFPITEPNLKFLVTNFENFKKDCKILELYEQIKIIEEHPELYVPMVCLENNEFVYKNTHSSIPAPSKNDLIQVLWEARKYGITVWDNEIESILNLESTCQVSKKFLKTPCESTYIVDQQSICNLQLFKKLIESSNKILFAINGNDQELPKIVGQLRNLNYDTDQFCILFRSSNAKFNSVNKYIKENKINNKISDKIKFFFVDYSKPLTKLLLENEITFDLVFLANEVNYVLIPHTMRTFLLNCQNVVSTFNLSISEN
jgi:hypothetical protein